MNLISLLFIKLLMISLRLIEEFAAGCPDPATYLALFSLN